MDQHVTDVDKTRRDSNSDLIDGDIGGSGGSAAQQVPPIQSSNATSTPFTDAVITQPSPVPSSLNPPPSNPAPTEKSTAPISTRTSSRTAAKSTARKDEDKKYWSYDAGDHIKKSLGKFGGRELVHWLKELDNAMNFPQGIVRYLITIFIPTLNRLI